MSAPVKDMTTERGGSSAPATGDETMLAELRKSVTAIAEEVAKVAEKRTRAARQTAQDGTDALRSSIRRQPMIALGVATVAGALLAVLVVPRSALHARKTSSWGDWSPHIPHVTRADLYDVADTIQRSVSRAAGAVPLQSTFERLIDAVAKVEPSASLNTIVDKAGSWLKRAQAAASQAKD